MSYLKNDMRLRCNTPEHAWYTALASVGIVLYPIGIPVLFLGLMVRQPTTPPA